MTALGAQAPTLHKSLTIWQWNCRSLRGKKQSLTLFANQHAPDLIALQETGTGNISFSGYTTFVSDPTNRTAILVKSTLTAQQHTAPTQLDYTFVEVLPRRKQQTSLFVLNIYSPPDHALPGIDQLVRNIRQRTKGHKLIIMGDFNAHHTTWGYIRSNKKGTALYDAIQQNQLHLCNTPQVATRIGNSISRDTTPDLTLTHNIKDATWTRLDETLGSDHYIVQLQLPHNPNQKCKIGTARITNWKRFREETPVEPITHLEEWTSKLLETAHLHTKELTLTEDHPAVDAHLLHLWDACRGLRKRWKKHRTNRRLKIRIAKLTAEAAAYAQQLSQQNWIQFCDKLQGTLGTRRTWHMLRSLMGTGASKQATAHQLQRLMHNYQGTEDDLLNELRKPLELKPTTSPMTYKAPPYTGQANPAMDEPFTMAEIEAVIRKLTRNTAPGRDQIRNKLLRNLDYIALENLLNYINEHWIAATLPPQWKHADITLIPKPGKPLSPKNLRPISLTSCIGKVFEHLVHNRLLSHIEENDYFPDTMYGFRPHLSTQDVLLQLKEDIIDNLSNQNKKSILALDVKGAFDNISHDALYAGLASTNCGERTYNYVSSFLTDRTATIGIGYLRSPTFSTIPKGTPQGSVISPLLFNIAMKDLPPLLQHIPNLKHAIYADDLTMWTPMGSTGAQQDALQEAIQIVQKYLKSRGLECAPEKSALLTLCKRTHKKQEQAIPEPDLHINGQPVPKVSNLRILGLNIPKDGSGSHTILPLQQTLSQLVSITRRVSHRRYGLKEADTTRIIQAILISRMTYGAPYLALKNAEKEKLNIMIRQAYKTALGLPPKTATRKLLQLGLHNTWEELQEAHNVSQLSRLKLTKTGRTILARLGYTVPPPQDQKQRIPLDIRKTIRVTPIPRNMHPIYNQARRSARIRTLQIKYAGQPDVRYCDASPYPHKPAHAVSIIDPHGTELTAATICTTSTETAEELAIALAATTAPHKDEEEFLTIITDSQAACRNYTIGRICPSALHILRSAKTLPQIQLVWTPGHESLEGNEAAHAAARVHTLRAISQEGNDPRPQLLLKYTDILAHYRHERRRFPPPHPELTRTEATTLRQLQTNSYPHGTLLHAIHPTLYPTTCKFCTQPSTLYHMVWECSQTPSLSPNPNPTYEQWAARLTSSDLSDQRDLVRRARAASEDLGFPD